jgi:nicotinate-nucleotide pyrophosphorylase (carboxylating)
VEITFDMEVNELTDKLIELAFAEDIGDGDHTNTLQYS